MDIKLDFDSKQIADKLHEAMMSSTFKEIFSKAIEKEITRINSGWKTDEFLENTIKNYIRQELSGLLEKEYREKILEQLRKLIEGEKLEELCRYAVEKINVRY